MVNYTRGCGFGYNEVKWPFLEPIVARLVYMDGEGSQQTWQIEPGRNRIVIGRHPDCDLIAPDAGVSRRHCAITCEAGRYHIADLGSQNGTLVNSARVTRAVLKSHDIIRCAALVLQFFDDAVVGVPDTQPWTPDLLPTNVVGEELIRLRAHNSRQAARLGDLQDELAVSTTQIVALEAALQTAQAQLDQYVATQQTEVMQNLRTEFMASNAEQLARLAVVERELERADARLAAADLEIDELEKALETAKHFAQKGHDHT